jgi:hypothetical protein
MKRALLVFVFAVTVFSLYAPHALAAETTVDPKKNSDDAMCWTVEECRERIENSTASGTGTPYIWNDNLFVEKPGDCTLAKTGYCYAPTPTFQLIIPLGEVTSVQGLGGYVQVIYAFSIMLAAIGSVLTIMIAGLMWMTARGDAGKVSTARQLIMKGIQSVIILLSVAMIANIVDPTLTLLNPFRTPLIKQVNFIPPGSTCEVLRDQYKFAVQMDSGSTEKCGGTGKIDKLPEEKVKGGASVIGAAVGDVCIYSKCDRDEQSCIKPTGSNKYECMACEEFVTKTGQSASASACGQFGRGLTLPKDQIYKCEYFPPESTYQWAAEAVRFANYGFCAEIASSRSTPSVVDCLRLRDAAAGGCRAYEQLFVRVEPGWFTDGFQSFTGQATVSQHAREVFQNMCEQDVCAVSTKGCTFLYEIDYSTDVAITTIGCMPKE